MAEKYAPLRHHLEMLDQLGAIGMSSDESDTITDFERPSYRYLPPNWRADEVSNWLDDFDTVYFFDRANESDRRGAYPHQRRRDQPQRFSNRSRPVRGLPRNMYRPTWLSTKLTDWVQSNLRPSSQPYSFSNDADFMRFVHALAPSDFPQRTDALLH